MHHLGALFFFPPFPLIPTLPCAVKWKRFSYIHCSWDTRATLAQLAGFKRVLNYMKMVGEGTDR